MDKIITNDTVDRYTNIVKQKDEYVLESRKKFITIDFTKITDINRQYKFILEGKRIDIERLHIIINNNVFVNTNIVQFVATDKETDIKVVYNSGNLHITDLSVTEFYQIPEFKENNKNDKYVMVKGSGGFGDIMNVLVRAMIYADNTNRKLIINWYNTLYDNDRLKDHFNKEYTDVANPFNVLYSNPINNNNIDHTVNHTYYPLIWNDHNINLCYVQLIYKYKADNKNPTKQGEKHILTEMHQKIYDYNDPVIEDYEEDIVVFCGPHLNNIPKDLEREYYKKIRFSDEVISKSQDYINTDFNDNIIVGVHYRHGNGEFPNKNTLYDKYFANIRDIITRIQYNKNQMIAKLGKGTDRQLLNIKNGIKIFITTDSMEVVNVFRARYGDMVLHMGTWLPPKNSGPLHKHNGNEDRIVSGTNALKEMYVLSKCDYIVHNMSSFNWWSIHNSGLDNEFIYLVE